MEIDVLSPIQPDRLVQTAHFLSRSIRGRLYLYTVLPLQHLVFSDLTTKLVARARDKS